MFEPPGVITDVSAWPDLLRLKSSPPVATPSPAPATALVGRPEAAPRPGPTSRPQKPGLGPSEAGCEAQRPGVKPLRTNARHRNRAIEIQAIGQHFSLKRPQ